MFLYFVLYVKGFLSESHIVSWCCDFWLCCTHFMCLFWLYYICHALLSSCIIYFQLYISLYCVKGFLSESHIAIVWVNGTSIEEGADACWHSRKTYLSPVFVQKQDSRHICLKLFQIVTTSCTVYKDLKAKIFES